MACKHGDCRTAAAGLLQAASVFALDRPLDPVDFGAAGDGQADDTASLQQALDAAAAGPRVVLLRPGNYRITAELNVPAGVCLSGAMPRWEDSSTRILVGEPGFSALRLHISQCWTEAVTYGFLIEGTCGLVLALRLRGWHPRGILGKWPLRRSSSGSPDIWTVAA